MKKILLISLIIITLSGYSYAIDNKFSIGLNIGTQGSGVNFNYNNKLANNFAYGATIRFFDIRATDELLVYDYYTGTYRAKNQVSLIMFPVFGTGSYYPFEGKIANNFSPFLRLSGGPIIVLDGDENIDSFAKRWKQAKSHIAYGGNIEFGVEFRMPGRVSFVAGIGFDYFPMPEEIDFHDDYSGMIIQFSIIR
jgi:hypothetical protein